MICRVKARALLLGAFVFLLSIGTIALARQQTPWDPYVPLNGPEPRLQPAPYRVVQLSDAEARELVLRNFGPLPASPMLERVDSPR